MHDSALYWRTVVSSWNSEGKEADGDQRGTAYLRRVSSHHSSSINVYTNDQPIHPGTRSFVYADDLAVITQSTAFAPSEETLTSALVGLSEYYNANQLRVNPTKTQVNLFHLRNRECGKQLNISWNGVNLTHCNLSVYLGVTVTRDRTLSYKAHIEKTKKKVGTRNNIIRKNKKLKMGSHSNRTQVVCSSAMLLSCRVCLPGV